MDIVAARYQAGCASTNAASVQRLSASRSGIPGRIPRAIASGEQSSTAFRSCGEPPTTTGRSRSAGSCRRSTSTMKCGTDTQATLTRGPPSRALHQLHLAALAEAEPVAPRCRALLEVLKGDDASDGVEVGEAERLLFRARGPERGAQLRTGQGLSRLVEA